MIRWCTGGWRARAVGAFAVGVDKTNLALTDGRDNDSIVG